MSAHGSTDSPEPRRDFVGYGSSPPRVEWPGSARLAVSVVLNYEEGSERTPLEGDATREPLVEAQYAVPDGERELFSESTYEYGSRVGVWRILDLLDELDIAPTIFACGMALERNPDATAAFLARGCDLVGHGHRWVPHVGMTEDEERAHIAECVRSIRATTGVSVRGWFTRPPNTVHTRRLLAEAGLQYDCGAVNDDLPYFDDVQGRPFLVMPYSLDVNDTKFFKGQFFTGRDFGDYVIDSFDALYREGASTPRMMSIGLHSRIVGRPGRIGGLRRALEHIAGHSGVWFAGRDAIADVWLDRFAPPGTWNHGGA